MDARHRPCGNRHPGSGGTPPVGRRRQNTARLGPRGTGAPHLGLEGRVRSEDPLPAQANGLFLRLGTHAVYARSGLRPGGPLDVLQLLPRRAHLPRQAAGQLGHLSANGRQRRRGVPRAGAGAFLVHPLPGHRSGRGRTPLRGRGHHAPRDDAGRRGRGRASGPGSRPGQSRRGRPASQGQIARAAGRGPGGNRPAPPRAAAAIAETARHGRRRPQGDAAAATAAHPADSGHLG